MNDDDDRPRPSVVVDAENKGFGDALFKAGQVVTAIGTMLAGFLVSFTWVPAPEFDLIDGWRGWPMLYGNLTLVIGLYAWVASGWLGWRNRAAAWALVSVLYLVWFSNFGAVAAAWAFGAEAMAERPNIYPMSMFGVLAVLAALVAWWNGVVGRRESRGR